MESTGAKQLIFRGVKEKGKVKLLIDGMDVNNTFRGSVYYYYNFPIELVDRIEVIRGPGAVLYGSGAMSGVINVITKISDRLHGSRAFGHAASDDTYLGGMFFNHTWENFHIGVDGYYTQDNQGVKAGPDIGGRYGRSDEAGNDWSVGAVAERDNFKLTARIKRSKDGTAFGRLYFLPENNRDSLINTTVMSEIKYSRGIIPGLNITLRGGYSYYREELDSLAIPEEIRGGKIFNVEYSEDRLYGDISLASSLLRNHSIEGGIKFENNQEHEDKFHASTAVSPRRSTMPDNVIKPDVSRQIGSFYFNDQFHFSPQIDFSFGIRYDIYSDIDNAVNPRFGIIYRWNPALNFKAMYSRSFRVPSWIELYLNIPRPYEGKPDFSPEKSDTVEIGTLFQTENSRLGLNLYWTQIRDIILYDYEQIKYTQRGRDQFLGGELTWHYDFSINTDIDLGLSYVYGTNSDNRKLPDVASWLGNLIFMHSFDSGITSATHLRFASSCPREPNDTRDDLSGYIVVDETLSYRFRQACLLAGVKNVFDDNVRYPAPPNTFPKDFPRAGRTFIVQLSYDF
jgi:iron complex outermembrane receptor protein